MVYEVLMILQLGFKGPYHNIRTCLGNAFVIYDLHAFFLHFSNFSEKDEALFSYLVILFKFSEHDLSALKLLNH